MTKSLEEIQKKLKRLGNEEKAKNIKDFLKPGLGNMVKGIYL